LASSSSFIAIVEDVFFSTFFCFARQPFCRFQTAKLVWQPLQVNVLLVGSLFFKVYVKSQERKRERKIKIKEEISHTHI